MCSWNINFGGDIIGDEEEIKIEPKGSKSGKRIIKKSYDGETEKS